MSAPQIVAFTFALLAGGLLILIGGWAAAVLIHRVQRGQPPVPPLRRAPKADAAVPDKVERPPLKLPDTRV